MADIPEVSVIKKISDEVTLSEQRIIFSQASHRVKQATIKKFIIFDSGLKKKNKELAVEIAETKKRIIKLRGSLQSYHTALTSMDDNATHAKISLLEKEYRNKQLHNTSDSAVKRFQNKWTEYHMMYENAPLAIQRKKSKTSSAVSEFDLMKCKMNEQFMKRAFNRLKVMQMKKTQHFIIDFARNMVHYNENIKVISMLKNKVKNCKKEMKDFEAEKIRVIHYGENCQAKEYICKRSLNPVNILSQQELFGGTQSSNLPVLSFAGSLNIPVLQLPQDQLNAGVVEQEKSLKKIDVSLDCSIVSEYTGTPESQVDMQNKNITKQLPHGQEIISQKEKKTVLGGIDQDEKNKKPKANLSITDDKDQPITTCTSNRSIISLEIENISQSDRQQKKVEVLEDILLNPDETTKLIRRFYKKDAKLLPEERVVDLPNLSLLNKSISDDKKLEKNQTVLMQHQRVDDENPTDDLHENFMAKYQRNKSPVFMYAPNKNLLTRKEDNINGQSKFFSKNETVTPIQNEPSKDLQGPIEDHYQGGSKLALIKNSTEKKEVVINEDINTAVKHIDTNVNNLVGEINEKIEVIPEKKGAEKESSMSKETSQELSSDENVNLSMNTTSLNENLLLKHQTLASQNNSFYPSSYFSLNEMTPSYGSPLDSEYGDESLQDYSSLIDPIKQFTTQTTVDEPAIIQKDAQPVESSEVKQKEKKSTFQFGMGAFSSNPYKMFTENNERNNDPEEIEKPDETLKFLFNRGENSKKSSFFNFSK